MKIEEFTVTNTKGIHVRPASLLSRTAAYYDAETFIEKDGKSVSVKEVMAILTLESSYGSTIRITVDGEEENEAMDAIRELIEDGFREAYEDDLD